MPRYEWQTTRTGGRRYVRIENAPIPRAVPVAVKAETVAVPQEAMVIEPPDPPVVAAVELDPEPAPVVSDATIKVSASDVKAPTVRRRRTRKKSDG